MSNSDPDRKNIRVIVADDNLQVAQEVHRDHHRRER